MKCTRCGSEMNHQSFTYTMIFDFRKNGKNVAMPFFTIGHICTVAGCNLRILGRPDSNDFYYKQMSRVLQDYNDKYWNNGLREL